MKVIEPKITEIKWPEQQSPGERSSWAGPGSEDLCAMWEDMEGVWTGKVKGTFVFGSWRISLA